MNNLKSAINELLKLKDDLALKTHLLQMDLKDEWHALEKKIQVLENDIEHDLLAISQKIGHAEEEFFVGDVQEIESLVEELKALKAKTLSANS